MNEIINQTESHVETIEINQKANEKKQALIKCPPSVL